MRSNSWPCSLIVVFANKLHPLLEKVPQNTATCISCNAAYYFCVLLKLIFLFYAVKESESKMDRIHEKVAQILPQHQLTALRDQPQILDFSELLARWLGVSGFPSLFVSAEHPFAVFLVLFAEG